MWRVKLSLIVLLLSTAAVSQPRAAIRSLATLTSAAAQPTFDTVIEGLLTAFDTHDVVALGEWHGNVPDSDLRISLVQHPEFAGKVDVIVVEFANPAHQPTIDRFVGGEDVPREELRLVWRDVLGGYLAWESPVYEAFFEAVRSANAVAKPDERLRVLAGDVPIDWSRVQNLEDYLRELEPHMSGPYIDRGSAPAKVIAREVLSKNLKALVIYGSGHCERWSGGFVAELDAQFPGRVFAAAPVKEKGQEKLRELLELNSTPGLLLTHTSPLSTAPASDFLTGRGGGEKSDPVKDVVDALVYFGDVAPRLAPVPSDLGFTPAYTEERARRTKIFREWREWLQTQLGRAPHRP